MDSLLKKDIVILVFDDIFTRKIILLVNIYVLLSEKNNKKN